MEKEYDNEMEGFVEDIAEEYGVSRERIRQIEHNALQKLRKVLTAQAN